jgi:hypothetical protein
MKDKKDRRQEAGRGQGRSLDRIYRKTRQIKVKTEDETERQTADRQKVWQDSGVTKNKA